MTLFESWQHLELHLADVKGEGFQFRRALELLQKQLESWKRLENVGKQKVKGVVFQL